MTELDPRLALLLPADEIESGAWDQIKENLSHPWLVRMAVMPDVHTGYDLPIGVVALLDGYLSPSYVGYDIGCGMCSVTTTHTFDPEVPLHEYRAWYDAVLRAVPVGFNSHDKPLTQVEFKSASGDKALTDKVNAKASKQLGTLGGGNHFIEIGVNQSNKICVTVHSGSRNSGHSIAGYWMKRGRFLKLGTPSTAAENYWLDMMWADQYALDNRQAILTAVELTTGLEFEWNTLINESHNHAYTLADGTMLHRKGATQANLDQLGVIPGNMRDGVWVTRGLGNDKYLASASHGAGRAMSRTKARHTLDLAEFQQSMAHIITGRLGKHDIDEAPNAYKPVDKVLAQQDGVVVDIVDHIRPLVNVKG